MKKIYAIFLVSIISFTTLVYAEEFSDDANLNYGYNELYDETANQEDVTSNRSDDIKVSYDENYDESLNQNITSSIYDDKEQSYYQEYDERVTEIENKDASQTEEIKVFLNGKQLIFDVEPKIINNRTMVPMRVIFESLGAEVTWDESIQSATGKTNKTTIKITIGKDYLLKNDNIVILDSPAVIISDRTLVPIRAIAESLDCHVEWYGETQVVEILK